MSTFDPGAAAGPDSGIFGLPHTIQEAKVVVVPVPFEATCSYGGGTSHGPQAILEASRQVDLFDPDTGRPYESGMAMLPIPAVVQEWNTAARREAVTIIESGGVKPGDAVLAGIAADVDTYCEKMNGWVRARTQELLREDKLVATLGGDHSTVFGAIEAHAEKYPGMGILHVDAHADLRLAFEGFTWSHASIMRNVVDRIPGVSRLVQVGIRDFSEEEFDLARQSNGRIHLHTDADTQARLGEGQAWSNLVQRFISPLPEQVYISWDIDGLEPALCPHTGTPVPGGLNWGQAMGLLRILAQSGRRIVGLDLNEVTPGPEGDEWDANVGARLLYKMLGWALKTR